MTLITITQNFGGDGMAIARKVADGLGIELFDDRKLQGLLQARGIPSEEIGRFDEKAPGFLDNFMGSRPQVFLDILESVMSRSTTTTSPPSRTGSRSSARPTARK